MNDLKPSFSRFGDLSKAAEFRALHDLATIHVYYQYPSREHRQNQITMELEGLIHENHGSQRRQILLKSLRDNMTMEIQVRRRFMETDEIVPATQGQDLDFHLDMLGSDNTNDGHRVASMGFILSYLKTIEGKLGLVSIETKPREAVIAGSVPATLSNL